MKQDDPFLESIRTDPHDLSTRMIYADWLDERKDPRADLIRIEEEMKQIPVHIDSYWYLKTRRNELRQNAPLEWLQLMRYGMDCPPMFHHGIPEGWKERWRLVREFMDRWNHVSLSDVGETTKAIQDAEKRVGKEFPPSVCEWVRLETDLWPNQNNPIRLLNNWHRIMLEGERETPWALRLWILGIENSLDDHDYAVLCSDFHLPDPPVHHFHPDYDNGDWDNIISEKWEDTTSGFALKHFLYQQHQSDGTFGVAIPEPVDLVDQLSATYPAQSQMGSIRIFEANNLLILVCPLESEPKHWLHVRIMHPTTREELPQFLLDLSTQAREGSGVFTSPNPSDDIEGQPDDIPF